VWRWLMDQGIVAARHSGVALRLPPHSITRLTAFPSVFLAHSPGLKVALGGFAGSSAFFILHSAFA